jgi:hypothetical protein
MVPSDGSGMLMARKCRGRSGMSSSAVANLRFQRTIFAWIARLYTNRAQAPAQTEFRAAKPKIPTSLSVQKV